MVLIFGDRRSTAGFEVTDLGERSTDKREACRGEGESVSDLVPPRISLLTTLGVAGDALLLGVAGDALLFGVSDKVDLFKFGLSRLNHKVELYFKL